MAERITDEITPRAGRTATYPWSEWADGTKWKAVQGEDFKCKVASFTVILHKQAKTLGKKVILDQPTEGVVRFVFVDRPEGYVSPVRKAKAASADASAVSPAPQAPETAVVGIEEALSEPEAATPAEGMDW